MSDDIGVSAEADRATAAEPVVSALRDGIPDAWECFCDAAYFDLWCVRRVEERTFGQGFHLVNADEARALCGLLNSLDCAK